MLNNKKLLIAGILLTALCSQVEAQTINADGSWHEFDVDQEQSKSGGLEWIDLDGNPLTFDFTLTGEAIFDVVDLGYGGDRFFTTPLALGLVLNYQERIGKNTFSTSVGLDYDQAYTDINYSLISIKLAPGSYSISGVLQESALDDNGSPLNATVGAVRLTSVPLPAAAWLYLTGTALMGFISRRRKTQ